MRRPAALVSWLAALLAGCGDEPAAPLPPQNLLLITTCGLRADQLEAACAAGELPALADLRDHSLRCDDLRAPAPADCRTSHAALFGTPSFVAPLAQRQLDTLAFLSRSELDPALCGDQGFARVDRAPIEPFRLALIGPDAAEPRLRRSIPETARAAIAALSKLARPFVFWVQLNASACESPERELAAAGATLRRELDQAVGALLAELAVAGRDERTLVLFATDHGELQGEDGAFGWRASTDPAVLRTLAWIRDPRTPTPAGRLATGTLAELGQELRRRMGLPLETTARDSDAATTPAPTTASASRSRFRAGIAMTEEEAHTLRPRLESWLGEHGDDRDAAELLLALLFTLPDTEEGIGAARNAACTRTLPLLLAEPAPSPFALTLAARSDLVPELPKERRLVDARRAIELAPWYFPPVRVVASSLQQSGDLAGARQLIESFGRLAPLSAGARTEFEQRLTGSHIGR